MRLFGCMILMVYRILGESFYFFGGLKGTAYVSDYDSTRCRK